RRRPDDLLEHRRLVQFFAESERLLVGALLGPLAIVDVGCRGVPADDASLLVAERRVADEVPQVLAVVTTRPDLAFVGKSAGEGGAGRVPQLRELIRVK